MSPPTFNPRRELAILLLISIAGCLVGGYIAANGWNGLASGEIVVYPRRLPSYLAKSTGPNASDFHFHVWFRLLFGGAIALVGLFIPLAFVFATPARRRQVLLLSSTVRAPKAPKWLTVFTLLALLLLLLWSFVNAA